MASYEDLKVWQKSMDFTAMIYRTTKAFPKDERFGLVSQMRRAAISIPSNIAEGKGRSDRDFARFLLQARGSGWELETQLQLALRLGYLSAEQFSGLREELGEIGKMLSTFVTTLKAESALASD